MSLTIEPSNLSEFEKAVNTPEETAKIAAAFAKEEQEFKEKQKNVIPTDTGIIQDIVKQIRNAKSDEEAKQILIDNAVSLYHTETIASLVYFSSIEGPCPIYRDEEEVKGLDDNEPTKGIFEPEEELFEGLTSTQKSELDNLAIRFWHSKAYIVFTERSSGKEFILNNNGEKVYWEEFKEYDINKHLFGITNDYFDKKYNECCGFDVKEPKNNIKPISEDFNGFIKDGSKHYAEVMRKQNQSGASRARNKEQETNSDNK